MGPRLLGSISLVLALGACRDPGTTPGPGPRDPAGATSLPDRDPALAHRLVEREGALLLDVRTPEEFAQGHIEGARNIPHDHVPSRLAEIEQWTSGDKSTPIVVYCRSGRRSGIAKQSLVEHGFGQVTNLGGMSDW